jgi:hypothetical protein
MANTNYTKFGPTATIVQFTRDRGELRTNDYGDFFFREMMDGRFTCASPELERILADLHYRAGQQVSIARTTRNRAVEWKVKLVDAASEVTALQTSPVRAAVARDPLPPHPPAAARPELVAPPPVRPRAPIPESKYATPAPSQAWEDLTPALEASLAPKPPARAAESRAAAYSQAMDQVAGTLQECLHRAIDIARNEQSYAVQQGFPISFSADSVQDLASTLYIQISKASNIQAMNNRDEQRRASR